MILKQKIICYLGSYDPDYSRNRVLIRGLELNNCQVKHCCDHSKIGLTHYIKLFERFIAQCRDCDAIVVGVLGHYDVPLAWVLAKLFRKKLIFDAFISLYDTYAFDRKVLLSTGWVTKKVYLWDYISCHLADKVVLDTTHHAQYFMRTFKLNPKKVNWLFIGADDLFFKPQQNEPSNKFIVEFHGSFQPLQGVDFIVKAAALLKNYEDIIFRIIGEGQTRLEVGNFVKKTGLKNVEFVPKVGLEKIKDYIAESDVCLGIFGKSDKAKRVIPNKAYEVMAMGKPLITMESEGTKELFKNRETAILIKNDDPKNLAEAILLLKKNKKLSDKIVKNSFELYKKQLTPKSLGIQFKKIVFN
jgi:glycosyltransferase involved in cell wall biosynthesis